MAFRPDDPKVTVEAAPPAETPPAPDTIPVATVPPEPAWLAGGVR